MRILVLTIQYLPSISPNVFRWQAIAEYWVKQGHEVHLLCAQHSARPREESIHGVHIHRVGHATLMDWAYNFWNAQNRRHEPGAGVHRVSLWRWWLEKLLDFTWRAFYWPDGSCLWYRPARHKAEKLIQQKSFDVLISVGTPFTTHWAAYYCKKRCPHLHWLMDVQDPFSIAREFPSNNFTLYNWLNQWAEKRTFAQANTIVLTNLGAFQRYDAAFPGFRHKMRLIPPLWALPKAAAGFTLPRPSKSVIHLGYFGSFYSRIRTPEPFLHLLEALLQDEPAWSQLLVANFWGALEPEFLRMFTQYPALKPMLALHGLVSREETTAAMQSVDILLHIGNTTDYHLPSKSVDYLFSRKPIIHIATTPRDSFLAFAGKRQGLLTLYAIKQEDLAKNAAKLSEFLHSFKAGRLQVAPPHPSFTAQYQTPAIAQAYEEALAKQRC